MTCERKKAEILLGAGQEDRTLGKEELRPSVTTTQAHWACMCACVRAHRRKEYLARFPIQERQKRKEILGGVWQSGLQAFPGGYFGLGVESRATIFTSHSWGLCTSGLARSLSADGETGSLSVAPGNRHMEPCSGRVERGVGGHLIYPSFPGC